MCEAESRFCMSAVSLSLCSLYILPLFLARGSDLKAHGPLQGKGVHHATRDLPPRPWGVALSDGVGDLSEAVHQIPVVLAYLLKLLGRILLGPLASHVQLMQPILISRLTTGNQHRHRGSSTSDKGVHRDELLQIGHVHAWPNLKTCTRRVGGVGDHIPHELVQRSHIEGAARELQDEAGPRQFGQSLGILRNEFKLPIFLKGFVCLDAGIVGVVDADIGSHEVLEGLVHLEAILVDRQPRFDILRQVVGLVLFRKGSQDVILGSAGEDFLQLLVWERRHSV
mmetsp:Transcript_91631/g.200872  ORF Transcript_91631/g.200872 Transcript_91631/m.200872 type:complete len:282 (+) Transcript_91631:278-1123(+)